MTRGILLTAAAFVMLAAPAFAQDKCSAPNAPAIPNGKTAATAELVQAQKDVVAFIKSSDDYQVCILAAITASENEAKENKKAPGQRGAGRFALRARCASHQTALSDEPINAPMSEALFLAHIEDMGSVAPALCEAGAEEERQYYSSPCCVSSRQGQDSRLAVLNGHPILILGICCARCRRRHRAFGEMKSVFVRVQE